MPCRQRTPPTGHDIATAKGGNVFLTLFLLVLDRLPEHEQYEKSEAAANDPKNGFPLFHFLSLPKQKGNRITFFGCGWFVPPEMVFSEVTYLRVPKKKPTRNFRFSGRPIPQLVGLLRLNPLGDRRTESYIGWGGLECQAHFLRGRTFSRSLSKVNTKMRSADNVLMSVWRSIILAPVMSPTTW
jgi:hypothetical protein